MMKLVKKFRDIILERYPQLYVGIDYDPELDIYDIWHNDPELEFNDENFKLFIGDIAKTIFFDRNIYNFVFGYDYFKAKNLESKPNTNKYSIVGIDVVEIEFYFNKIEEETSYSNVPGETIVYRPSDPLDIKFSFQPAASISGYSHISKMHKQYNNTFCIVDIGEVA